MPIVETTIARVPPGKTFFFVDVPDVGSVICYRDRVNFDQSKIAVGATISFDYENKPGKGLRALRPISLVKEADPSAAVAVSPAPASTAVNPTTTAVKATNGNGLQWPEVSLDYGKLLTAVTEDLPVTVKLTLGRQPATGWGVELYQDGGRISRPNKKPSTDAQGQATFIATLYNREQIMPFSVAVFNKTNPKKKQEFAFVWKREESQTQTVAAPAPPPTPEIKFARSWATPEIYRYDLEFTSSKDITVESNLQVSWRRPGEITWKNKSQGFSTDLQGKAAIELTLPDGQRGFVEFKSGDVKSKPDYVLDNKGVAQLQAAP